MPLFPYHYRHLPNNFINQLVATVNGHRASTASNDDPSASAHRNHDRDLKASGDCKKSLSEHSYPMASLARVLGGANSAINGDGDR